MFALKNSHGMSRWTQNLYKLEAGRGAHFPFPLSVLTPSLTAPRERPGRSRAFSGGFACRRWRGRGAGVDIRLSLLVFGYMPVVWSRASSSSGQISSSSKCGSTAFLLRRPEWEVVLTPSTISANKACWCCLLICCCLVLLLLLLAGRGGEGVRRETSYWRDLEVGGDASPSWCFGAAREGR
jgi:hypothetical protein